MVKKVSKLGVSVDGAVAILNLAKESSGYVPALQSAAGFALWIAESVQVSLHIDHCI